MRYGYFDDKNREYVIDRPDTPAPWVNYLGSPEYGAIISNHAGGYSFVKSGANGGFSVMFLTILISREDTSIFVTISPGITGPPPGSRWARISHTTKAPAATEWDIPA